MVRNKMTKIPFTKIEAILDYTFKDQQWLERALTHASQEGPNYERLEFLGDRVLGLAVSDILFRKYPNENEGALARRFSALVRGQTLSEIGKEIKIEQYILFSNSDKSGSGTDNENVIADVMEALLGAIYIDGGFEPCQKLITKFWYTRVQTMTSPPQDPKTELQEWAQAKGLGVPLYEIVRREGPDHAPEFTIRVTVQGLPHQEAKASNRRQAEKDSAKKLIRTLK